MKDKRHIKSFNEATENLNISDFINRIFREIKFEQRIIHKNQNSDEFTEGFDNCVNLLKTIIEQETGLEVKSDEISKKYGL